jgi:hypothetical protein
MTDHLDEPLLIRADDDDDIDDDENDDNLCCCICGLFASVCYLLYN